MSIEDLRSIIILLLVLSLIPISMAAVMSQILTRKINRTPAKSFLVWGLWMLSISVAFGLFNNIVPMQVVQITTGILRVVGWFFVFFGLYSLFNEVDRIL